uniref:Cytochrome b6/f complex subunit VI n=1 Tax=Selaginella tamariscina TaxID=137178 RepID=A0A482CIN4_9TRAC|nr:cytochrome b6/f complex subunit VI [Selaginella tamariscina]QBL76423.1 cytochrome b6/f complex subunit VI [Selaginella tamariscina]
MSTILDHSGPPSVAPTSASVPSISLRKVQILR